MKKLAALILGLVVSTATFAQDHEGLRDLLDRYSDMEGAFGMTLNQRMLDAVDVDVEWEDQMKHISGDIYQVRFIMFSDEDKAPYHIRELDKAISRLGFKEIPLETTEDDIEMIRTYGFKKDGYYRTIQFLLLDDDHTGYLMSVKGKLKVKSAS